MEINDEPWQAFECDECGQNSPEFIRLMKNDFNDENEKVYICKNCLQEALAKIKQAAREWRNEVRRREHQERREANEEIQSARYQRQFNRRASMMALYDSGKTLREIAAQYGISGSAARDVILRAYR